MSAQSLAERIDAIAKHSGSVRNFRTELRAIAAEVRRLEKREVEERLHALIDEVERLPPGTAQ